MNTLAALEMANLASFDTATPSGICGKAMTNTLVTDTLYFHILPLWDAMHPMHKFCQCIIYEHNQKEEKTSNTLSCSGPIPAQKSSVNSVPGARIFPPNARNGFSLFPSF